MRLYYAIQKWVLILFYFSISNNIYTQETQKLYDVDVRIWTEKRHYFTREPVIVYIRIENKEEDGPRLPSVGLGEYFVVEDSRGKQFHSILATGFYDLDSMKPGQVIEYHFDVSSFIRREESRDTFNFYLPPERYTLYFSWKDRMHMEPIVSNKIEISINNPVGEELQAFNLFNEGMIKGGDGEDPDSYFDELINRYPKSIYAERAFYYKLLHRHYKEGIVDVTKNMQTGKEFLAKYPDSKYRGYAFGAIRKYYKKNNDLDGFIKYLRELDRNTKGVLVKETIEIILQNIYKTNTWDDTIPKSGKKENKKKSAIPMPPRN